MANEKMVEYYEFDKETELYKLVSELGEKQREDYINGFVESSEEVEHKIELFINQFIKLVYGENKGIVGRVTKITDQQVELCLTEL